MLSSIYEEPTPPPLIKIFSKSGGGLTGVQPPHPKFRGGVATPPPCLAPLIVCSVGVGLYAYIVHNVQGLGLTVARSPLASSFCRGRVDFVAGELVSNVTRPLGE